MHNASISPMNATGSERRIGFTLLEILVTVSILTMLIAVMVPAVMQARATTRRTVCQSNLRQWALGVQMYADAHHGELPFRGQGVQPTTRFDAVDDWINAIPPYVESAPYIDLVTPAKNRRLAIRAFGFVRTQ